MKLLVQINKSSPQQYLLSVQALIFLYQNAYQGRCLIYLHKEKRYLFGKLKKNAFLIKFQDFQTLLQHNLKNSFFRSQNHSNDTYDTAPPPTYLNFVNPRSYDFPRLLQPPTKAHSLKSHEDNSYQNVDKTNSSPLQSPTDSESVFTDDDWSQNTGTSDRSK